MHLIILTLVAALLAVAYCRTRGPVTAPGPVWRPVSAVVDEGHLIAGTVPEARQFRARLWLRDPDSPGQR